MNTYNIEYDNTIEVVVAQDFEVTDGVLLFINEQGQTIAALNTGWRRVWIVENE